MSLSPRLSLSVGVAACGIALLPATAHADPPTVQIVTRNVDQGAVGSCGDFDVLASFDVTRRETTFYNAAGTPIRLQVHVEAPGTVTNSVTGESLPTKGIRNITVNLITGERKSTGSNVHVVVPGEGTVQLAAGMSQIDENGELVREVGRLDPPVTPALCEALS
jgi:hypothetical protein